MSQKGALFQEKIELSGAENSDAYFLPVGRIDAIAVKTTGTPSVYATIDTREDIEDDTAVWELWDGTKLFNIGITAIKAENSSGDATIMLSIRGSE